MEQLLLGVEVGTSAIKAVAYTVDGDERVAARRPVPLRTPQPGWAEQDATELWEALVAVLRDVVDGTAAHGRIAALALAAQAGSILAVDGRGEPLSPLITWLDSRAAPIVDAWSRDGSAARIRQVSGWHPYPGLGLPILAWLTQNEPAIAAGAAHYLDAQGFLLQRLTGRPVTDYSEAAELLLLDRTTRSWSRELCTLAGIDPAQLGDIIAAGAVAGRLLPAAAAATGLPDDTLVVAGGQDQCCAALGMGVMAPGQLMLASGTAWVITAIADAAHVARIPPGMDLNFHVVPERHTVSQLLGGFGAVVDWWLNVLWPGRADRYAALDAALSAHAGNAGDPLFLPLGGSAQAKAAPGGFLGLRLDHTREDMARALCEGICYEVRWSLDTLAGAGLPAQRLWMSGGATHSPRWPALLADMTGVPVYVARGANWTARGAARLAGIGAGLLDDLSAAAETWRRPMQVIDPDPHAAGGIDTNYARYRDAAQLVTRLAAPAPGAETR